MAPHYTDPLHDMLDELENSVERLRDPQALTPPMGDAGMDPLGQRLTALEESIEWADDPAPVVAAPEPFSSPPTLLSLARGGPRSPDPPRPAEPAGRGLDGIEPPLAARPFFAHDGLASQSYHPQMGGSTGLRGDSPEPTRWCPERNETVAESTCECCENWGDHGAGVEQCLHDWREENDRHEKTEDED